MTMSRRIFYSMVFVTLFWRASAENVQNIFKNNVSRTDFGKLLQALIKLNEQRVNVLQKLNKIEDYTMLSEILRSGGTKSSNGNNMYLVILSKNESVPTRRNMDLQVVESIPSLNIETEYTKRNPVIRSKSIKRQVKQKNILVPASVSKTQSNISQDNYDIDFGDALFSKVSKKLKGRFQIDDGRHNTMSVTTTSKMPGVDHFLNYPELDMVETKDSSKIHKSVEDYIEDETSNIYSKIANETLNMEGESLKNPNTLKYTLNLQSSEGQDTSNENDESNHLSIPHETYSYNVHDKFPTTLRDVTHVVEATAYVNNKQPDISGPKHTNIVNDNNKNMYPNTITSDIPLLDHNNEHSNMLNNIQVLNETNKKPNIPKQFHSVDDLANKNTNTLKKMLKDQVGGFPKILKDMYNADHSYKYQNVDKQAHDVHTDKSQTIAGESYNVEVNPKYPEMPKDVNGEDEHSNLKVSDDVDDVDYDNLHTINNDGFDNKKSIEIEKSDVGSFESNTNGLRTPVDNVESRKTFKKCINRHASKLCTKSCINAYKNVCRRLKCTSRAKRGLKKECKRSCKKTFSSPSKYSSEDR